jgi:hypothetical protein
MQPNFREHIIEMYSQEPDITRMGLFTTYFKTQPDSFADVDTLDWDIIRSRDEIAPAVHSLASESVSIHNDVYTTKEAKFPTYRLNAPVNIMELMTRQPGENAYTTQRANWYGLLARKLEKEFVKMTRMLKIAMEAQAAQILQTGKVSLTNKDGAETFSQDYAPKATHFPEATEDWTGGAGNPIKDIENLAGVISDDGQCDTTTLIFGKEAWSNFFNNADVQKLVNREVNTNLGSVNPQLRERGAKWMGYININGNRYEMWTYNAQYNPFGSASVENAQFISYLDTNKVLVLPDADKLDLRRYFGAIPNIKIDPVFDPIFGGKIPIGNEFDFLPRVYRDEQKDTFVGEIKSRPLFLPVSIDRFGCLNTVAAA